MRRATAVILPIGALLFGLFETAVVPLAQPARQSFDLLITGGELELVDKADGRASAIYFGMREEDVEFALSRPWTTVGSDGSALAPDGILGRSHPHPRSYGTFPRVLARYVRERKIMALPEAIRKMTSLAASRLSLSDRGTLAPGRKADIVAFDPATIADRATFTAPHQLSTGVRWLIVNGQVVVADGEHTGARPGRVLRDSRRSRPS